MHYVCLDSNGITSILNYEPNVPEEITVVTITDEEKIQLDAGTHYFDLDDNIVKSRPQEYIDTLTANEAQRKINAEKREFLNNTDWKVMRHIRETALGQPTTLSDAEYLQLEQDRADAAAAIVEIQ